MFTTPICEVLVSGLSSACDKAMCCSAMSRTEMRLRIAPSKKLLICVGDMYREHSWKLATPSSQAGERGRTQVDSPLCHGGYVVRMALHEVRQPLRESCVLCEGGDGRMCSDPPKTLAICIERARHVWVRPHNERKRLQGAHARSKSARYLGECILD